MNIRNFLLGEFLHLANSRPPFGWKGEFYQLKDRLLNRYGVWLGRDLQHIVRYCYGCNGEGEIPETRSVFGNPWHITYCCPRCGGSGIYRQFWVNLKRYSLGRWNAINEKRGFGWDVNPWVWVIEFRKVEQ